MLRNFAIYRIDVFIQDIKVDLKTCILQTQFCCSKIAFSNCGRMWEAMTRFYWCNNASQMDLDSG